MCVCVCVCVCVSVCVCVCVCTRLPTSDAGAVYGLMFNANMEQNEGQWEAIIVIIVSDYTTPLVVYCNAAILGPSRPKTGSSARLTSTKSEDCSN